MLWLVLLCVMLGGANVQAQQLGLGLLQSPILTIEPDRLFADSDIGIRMTRQLEAERAVLIAENSRIEAELTADEKALTVRRPSMEPQAFRALADAFDRKVQETRRTQDSKALLLTQMRASNQQVFRQTALPILDALMREAGAGVILDRAAIFLSANAIDITDIAIARINAVLGDGSQSSTENEP